MHRCGASRDATDYRFGPIGRSKDQAFHARPSQPHNGPRPADSRHRSCRRGERCPSTRPSRAALGPSRRPPRHLGRPPPCHRGPPLPHCPFKPPPRRRQQRPLPHPDPLPLFLLDPVASSPAPPRPRIASGRMESCPSSSSQSASWCRRSEEWLGPSRGFPWPRQRRTRLRQPARPRPSPRRPLHRAPPTRRGRLQPPSPPLHPSSRHLRPQRLRHRRLPRRLRSPPRHPSPSRSPRPSPSRSPRPRPPRQTRRCRSRLCRSRCRRRLTCRSLRRRSRPDRRVQPATGCRCRTPR